MILLYSLLSLIYTAMKHIKLFELFESNISFNDIKTKIENIFKEPLSNGSDYAFRFAIRELMMLLKLMLLYIREVDQGKILFLDPL